MVVADHERLRSRPRARAYYRLALSLAVAAPLALMIDLSAYSLFHETRLPGELRRLIELSEVFAHGLGVAMILLTVSILDASHRRAILRLSVCSLGAGVVANLVKIGVARVRPRDGVPDTIWESFQGWLPLWRLGIERGMDSNLHSFPSAHAATAAGLAVGLSMIYPRGKWLFAVFAILASIQRVQAAAHYASDTLAGAALGCLVAAICCDHRLVGRHFDRFEAGAAKAHEC